MKRKLLLLTVLICSLTMNGLAQNNPAQHLTWSQWYEFPRNFFELNWDEPAQPHGELLGYNVYRNDQLYRFQTERTIYNYWTPLYGIVTNCDGESFFAIDSPEGTMSVYVRAVYQGEIESDSSETVDNIGLLLSSQNFDSKKAAIYPIPTAGILNISVENLEKIMVYDLAGKAIKASAPVSQIDLSDFSKGLYIVKLFTNQEVFTHKVILK